MIRGERATLSSVQMRVITSESIAWVFFFDRFCKKNRAIFLTEIRFKSEDMAIVDVCFANDGHEQTLMAGSWNLVLENETTSMLSHFQFQLRSLLFLGFGSDCRKV